jgi:DNA-binding beta-propeller fold protein YncE
VAAPDTNEVWRVDPITRKPTAIVHVDGYPISIALGAGSVWTANQLGGTVSRIDLSTGRIVSTIHVGNNPLALTIVGKRVWVTVS